MVTSYVLFYVTLTPSPRLYLAGYKRGPCVSRETYE